MRSRRIATVAVALSASLIASSPLVAQSAHRWSVQGSGLYVGVNGEAYEGLTKGAGGEIQVRYNPSAFSIGLGFQGSLHKLEAISGGEKQDVTLYGAFVEPRYVIDIGNDKFAPYIAARVALLRLEAEFPAQGVTYTLTTDGTQYNGGGGVLVRLTPRMNLDLGATYGGIKFGDVKASSGGTSVPIPDTSGSGKNLVVRVGVSVGLGR